MERYRLCRRAGAVGIDRAGKGGEQLGRSARPYLARSQGHLRVRRLAELRQLRQNINQLICQGGVTATQLVLKTERNDNVYNRVKPSSALRQRSLNLKHMRPRSRAPEHVTSGGPYPT